MTLPPDVYVRVRTAGFSLDLAKEKRARLAAEAARLEDSAARVLADTLRAAGLDPEKRYRFDDATLTLVEVTDGHADRTR